MGIGRHFRNFRLSHINLPRGFKNRMKPVAAGVELVQDVLK